MDTPQFVIVSFFLLLCFLGILAIGRELKKSRKDHRKTRRVLRKRLPKQEDGDEG